MSRESRILPHVRVTLYLAGASDDTGAVSDYIKLKPTRIWHRPSVVAAPTIPETTWEFCVQRPSDSIDPVMKDMLSQLVGREGEIQRWAERRQLHVSVGCSVLIYGDPITDRPVCDLCPQTLGQLAALGAEFTLDMNLG